ncbi:MAG TPA: S9 family peptidase [Candidatus Dormibacteraeota bacterium]|nr:S9 family peptidase [Candidatus Dormibacteraeota bacterium]
MRNRIAMRSGVLAIALGVALGVHAQAPVPAKRAITFDDLIKMHRVSDSQISRDGKWVAYAVSTPDMELNRGVSNIWIIPATGGEAIQVTQGGRDTSPAWSPDGKTLAFLSARDGNSQVYLLSMKGGEAKKLTQLSTGADVFKWAPDGKSIAFTSYVYVDCKDDACNAKRDEDKEKSKVKARIYDHLLYRHWDHWSEGKRSHLFVMAADGSSPARDLTPEADYDIPPDGERGGPDDINFSPDGKEICYTAVTDKVEAISTNADLFVVPVSGGEAKRITSNPGFDGNPVYSPDGRSIAYHAQLTAGYESDRWRIMLYDRQRGKSTDLTAGFDRSANELAWSSDSKTIYFTAENETLQPIYALEARAGATPKKLLDGYNSAFSFNGDATVLVTERTSLISPAELFVAAGDGSGLKQLTHHNDALLAQLEMNAPERFWFEGAEATKVEAMLVRPPSFSATKKYPMLVLLHGGPQTMWDDAWGYRWNEQVFSAPGYVTLLINRRGSTGYGQKFTDEITNDWGGKAYVDVMKGIDAAIAKYPFIDKTRLAAAGGSYGGYMADWLATHTDRFKAIISHAGVYDKVSMFATEELWFEEHDMQGTPWTAPENYKKWSPSSYAGELGKYKTPTLVVGGERDYRVPYTQSLEFFTALQRQGVPSKLLIFPDEGHWVLKPQNSQLWYKTFLDWLAAYMK